MRSLRAHTFGRRLRARKRWANVGRIAGRRRERGAHRKVRSRRFIWIRRGIITVALVIVLVVGGVVADYYYLGSLVKRVVVHHIQTVKPGATENILLIGSTTRCGLKQQSAAYGLCSQGVTASTATST